MCRATKKIGICGPKIFFTAAANQFSPGGILETLVDNVLVTLITLFVILFQLTRCSTTQVPVQ